MPKLKALSPAVRWTAAVLGGLLAVAVVLLVLALVVFPPRIAISPADGATEVSPDGSSLMVTTSRWGASISSVEVTRAVIDPDGSKGEDLPLAGHLREGEFVLDDGSSPLIPDAEYHVTVKGTVKQFGLSGISDEKVVRNQTFTTVTTPQPVLTGEGIRIKYGEDAVIDWNIPLSSFEYKLEGIESTSRLDAEDPSRVIISLAGFEQGKEYALTITSATSVSGIALKKPVQTSVVTAAPLTVEFQPADGTAGASIQAHPTLVFSEPVSNPDLVSSLVTIEPAMEGNLQWAEPNKLEFVPAQNWDYLQDVTVRISGGPNALRGLGGGFIASDLESTFTTAPYKMIDVDISDQVLTLYEDGVAVESFLCSTGIAGSRATPLGDYTIYAKLSKTDMRGPGYFAPDVPWVMVFKGDYTIHGNYWATAFGRPSSHGCVGLPVSTAKHIYDWTPLGTPVHIHQ